MRLTCLLLLSALAFAEEAQAPAPLIPLNESETARKADIESQFKFLQQTYELLRHDVCWRAGVKPEECGPWAPTGAAVQKLVKQ
jgi:hypothetical protein